jgi:hypothetical protein
MSRWIALTPDDLKAAGHGALVDAARTKAVGAIDPVSDAIENATAEIRNAVRAGNTLDSDEAKIPRSLKKLAVRSVLYALMERIGVALSEDQSKQATRDEKQLGRLFDRKLQVEPADAPDETGGPVNPGSWNSENKVVMRTHPVPKPGAQRMGEGRYANDDAPEDAQ